MGRGERLFDYGMAEALAFGSLLLQGTPVGSPDKIASVELSTSDTACWSISRTNTSTFRWRI